MLGVLYAILPIDLFPDLFVGWGQIDDLIILTLVLWYLFTGDIPRIFKPKHCRPRSSGRQQDSSQQGNRDSFEGHSHTKMTPHETLGVDSNASEDEIRAAYRRLANQYHPDKVHHLGAEFQQLAEAKFKAIQEAYQELLKK